MREARTKVGPLRTNPEGRTGRTARGNEAVANDLSRSSSRSSSWALLIAIVVLALTFAIVIPPFQSNDEHGHFVRVFEISRGRLLGRSSPELPLGVVDLIRRFPERIEDSGGAGLLIRAELTHPVTSTAEAPLHGMNITHRYLGWGVIGANIYCPVTYAPAVLGVWLARRFSVSPLAFIYAARFSNVALFGLAMTLALHLAPESRALLGAVALMPMTLQQVSVVSADASVISASFLAFASVLRTRELPVSPRLLAGLAVLFPVWAVCKPSPWTMIVTFLVGGVCFSSWRPRFLYIAGVGAAMVLVTVGWQIASAGNAAALRESRLANGIDINANVTYAVRKPMEFGETVASAMLADLPEHARQFWGVFGWSKFSGPWWGRWFYLLLIVFVAGTEELNTPLSRTERLLTAGVFLCGFVFVHLVIFITDAHPCQLERAVRLCFDNSAGVQGRYFIPFALFGLLALKQRWLIVPQRRLKALVLTVGIAQGVLVLILIANRFYTFS